MANSPEFPNVLTNWSFGIIILTGLISSEFLSSEVILAVLLSAFSAGLSAICGNALKKQDYYQSRKPANFIYFMIIWFDILTNLVATATCARFASATIDYISKGHFREFLFGIESHSLGEPWPDVLGVTIVVVVAILFMLGLEKSPVIATLLFLAIIGSFVFFILVGSVHRITEFLKWCHNFKVHSSRNIIRAAAICSFAFVRDIPQSRQNNCLKLVAMLLISSIFYLVSTVIFSLMTHRRELAGTALPLIQVFEHRDVDWARPVMAVLTICVLCLVLTETLPYAYNYFVKLANRDWQIFVSSMEYKSSFTGAPVLAIFAAGSLAAILAFACPLSHLIKLLNSSCILKCILNSSQLLYNRYKPENYEVNSLLQPNVHYMKLNQKPISPTSIVNRVKLFFGVQQNYISRSVNVCNINKREERECLLLDDYSNKSIVISEESGSDDEEEIILMTRSDDEDSSSSTDIDVVVQEYKDELQVKTVGKFDNKKPSTVYSSLIVIVSLTIIGFLSICIALYLLKHLHFIWPNIFGIVIFLILILCMPKNSEDMEKETRLPSCIYTIFLVLSIIINICLISTIIHAIWQGIIFWFIAGLSLFCRCDCCTCEGLYSTIHPKSRNKISIAVPQDLIFEYKDNSADTILITR